MTSRTTRVIRGLAAASIAVFVAAFSHVVGGGGAPGQAGAAVAAAFAAIACVGLAGRRSSLPRLVISVLISQFAFHLLFGVGGGTGSGLTVATSHHHGGTVSTLVAQTPPDALRSSLAGAPAHAHDATSMWLAHAFAALITIIVLAWGEAALRHLAELGRNRLVEPLRVLVARSAVQRLALLVALLDTARRSAVTRRSSIRHRRRIFGERVAPALRQQALTLGSRGHRGPPRGAFAQPSF